MEDKEAKRLATNAAKTMKALHEATQCLGVSAEEQNRFSEWFSGGRANFNGGLTYRMANMALTRRDWEILIYGWQMVEAMNPEKQEGEPGTAEGDTSGTEAVR